MLGQENVTGQFLGTAAVINILFINNLKDYTTNKFTNSKLNEPVHEISNNLVCATSKASDQPAHMRSLIRDFASRLSII